MMNAKWINDFIKEAHGTAVEKGWWETERPVDEVHVLIHSEISEAVEHYRAGAMKLFHLPNGKPDGFGIEIADVAIRAADALGRLQYTSKISDADAAKIDEITDTPEPNTTIMTLLNALHNLTSEVSASFCIGKSNFLYCEGLEIIIWRCYCICKFLSLDFKALAAEKMAYNKTRPYRHGGKVA
jgi:hypothetical protein